MGVFGRLEFALPVCGIMGSVLCLAKVAQRSTQYTRTSVALAASHRQIHHEILAVSHPHLSSRRETDDNIPSPLFKNASASQAICSRYQHELILLTRTALFGGAIFIPTVVVIPQRFQVVNDLSAFSAGWRLLALMLCSPLGSGISGFLVSKVQVPPLYIFLTAAILQTIGLALMGTLSVADLGVQSVQYAYQVILGLGIGLTLSSILVAAPTVIEEKDTGTHAPSLQNTPILTFPAVFIGALTQARILGGSIGLSVGTNVLNDKVKSASDFLSQQQLQSLLNSAQSIKTLPPSLQEAVRQTFAKGYNEQMQVLAAFGGAAVLAALMMWERKPRRMP